MTDVRVRSAVVRSVLGLPSRLPEIAIGFSDGGLIASTHLRETRHKTRRFTWPPPPSFQKDEAPQVVGEVRQADHARAGTMPMVRTISIPMLFFRSPNTCATRARLFARRIGGLPRPAAFAIAIGRATNAAFEATRGRAFLRPHRGDRRCRLRLAVLPLAMPVKDWLDMSVMNSSRAMNRVRITVNKLELDGPN